MKIAKVFMTEKAQYLKQTNNLVQQALDEVKMSICSPIWPMTSDHFTINNSNKNINGVVPIKELCYIMLEEKFNWYREKPLDVFRLEKKKGGPIDVYKKFKNQVTVERVGLEFETGNISSAHRSMNKLLLGIKRDELDLAIILMPISKLSYYLTERVANFEELEPYFEITESYPFVFIGFDAEEYSSVVPIIPKGKDGMSKRSIKKWKNQAENLI